MKNLIFEKKSLLSAFLHIDWRTMAQKKMTLFSVLLSMAFSCNALEKSENDLSYANQCTVNEALTSIAWVLTCNEAITQDTNATSGYSANNNELNVGKIDKPTISPNIEVSENTSIRNRSNYCSKSFNLPLDNTNTIALKTNDILIICQASGDGNLEQVNQRYKLKPNALFLKEGDLNPISSITQFLEDKSCNNLHLYITFSENDIMINDFRLSQKNIMNYASLLKMWKKNVAGDIIIHNLSVAESAVKPAIIDEIENSTGLKVQVLRTY